MLNNNNVDKNNSAIFMRKTCLIRGKNWIEKLSGIQDQ